ncbi:hypothetical protein [Ktedonospora formicarum]|uniref:Uncharacterized protein n=1 Tax=Ktedonospora formicarum TaxID=2778364 RepID=A0A8J3HZ85_9CHLR|nr:hypothetical protein [Ktedonospora formicarum]GHO42634.1 hypothetical protein KSX_07970 [Ktedonospora formicarum]
MATVVKEQRQSPNNNHHRVEIIDSPEAASSRKGWTITWIVAGSLALIGIVSFLVMRRLSADEV